MLIIENRLLSRPARMSRSDVLLARVVFSLETSLS